MTDTPKRTYSKTGKSKAAAMATKRAEDAKKTGRPVEITDEVKAEILRRLSEGETLMRICSDEHMPARWSVIRLSKSDEAFCVDLARARVDWSHAQADIIIEIADDSSKDWKTRTFAGKTELVPDREVVDRSKVKIDARKWLMARFDKHTFSDDAAKIPPTDPADAAEAIKQDATVIAPDESGPKDPVL